MKILRIESYDVQLNIRQLPLPEGDIYYTMNLRGTSEGAGATHALIQFQTQRDPSFPGYEAGLPGEITLFAWLPFDLFVRWYDILRNESPVSLSYYTNESDRGVGQLELFTGPEPLGEGLADKYVTK
ncbi:hypothetical protein [Kocuria nitroreducens]|uniref:hypothetical protein n=1 Tax=Kocuria nitroreducens TaxID=3058914 RepID=UPI0036DC7192